MTLEAMAAPLRGNLGLRSSPLNPTSSKLSSQYMVIDHMTNHYNKIIKAKSAIDNKPPKSLTTSQKLRDQRSREIIKKFGAYLPNASYSQPHSAGYEDIYDESQWDEPENDEERLVYSVMRATLKSQPRGNADLYGTEQAGKESSQHASQTVQRRPLSSRSHHSQASNISRSSLANLMHKGTYDGDILDKHSQVFTEPSRPFTPRTLKSNRQSRLSQSNSYHPPPKRQDSKKSIDAASSKEAESKAPNTMPKPAPRRRSQVQKEDVFTDTSVTFETLQTRDMHQLKNKAQDNSVPPLNITMDIDHRNWLKEQAGKAELRIKSSKKTEMSGDLSASTHDHNSVQAV